MRSWIDSHSHWADLRLETVRDLWMKKAIAQGLSFSLQGGVDPEDWSRQKVFQEKFPNHIGLCFGLHPYWVATHQAEELETHLDLLAQEIHHAMALGETGLDLRPQYEDQFSLQMEAFQAQLEMAEVAQKPVVLHLVRAHDEALQTFDFWGVPSRGGMVHSFSGSWDEAKAFLDRGLKISLGAALLNPKRQRLQQVVQEIPWDGLLLETDLPDQPPESRRGEMNPPETLLEVAAEVARIKKTDLEEVLLRAEQSFRSLFTLA